MNFSLGTVIETRELNDSKTQVILLDNGRHEMFFSDFKSFNKSLKLNDRVKVYFKHSILAGHISYKATKTKAPAHYPALKAV